MKCVLAMTSISEAVGFGTTSTANTTGASRPSYVSEAIQMSGNSGDAFTRPFSEPLTDFWLSFHGAFPNAFSGSTPGAGGWMELGNSGGGSIVRCIRTGTNTAQLQRWNGSSWTNVALVYDSDGASAIRYDIHVIIHASTGLIALYKNNILIDSFVGDTSVGPVSVDQITFREVSSNSAVHGRFSAIWVSDEDTRSRLLVQRLATGNGTHTDWTGDYEDINGTGYSNTSSITTESDGDEESFTKSNLSDYTSTHEVLGHVLSLTGIKGDNTNGGVAALIRYGSVDYISDPIELTPGWRAHMIYQEVNPDTSAAWPIASLSTAEFGVISTPEP